MNPEVIFILVIILFSMLEGMVRKKKRGGQQLPNEGTGPQEGWPTPGQFPTDEGARGQSSEGTSAVGGPRSPSQTAEDLVPEDLWEEIAALARGDVEETLKKRRSRPAPTPRPQRPQPSESPPTPLPTYETYDPPPPPQVPTPLAERGGPDWSHTPETHRPTAPPPVPVEVAATPSAAEAVRGPSVLHPKGEVKVALRHRVQKRAPRVPLTEAQMHHAFRGRHALRHAIVAREVLGRPMALREQGDADLWSL